MFSAQSSSKYDLGIIIPMILLVAIGLFVLNSLSFLTPAYFVFVIIAFIAYFVFANIDFEILTIFSKYFYFGSIIFLLLPIFIGQATRGTIRWIPIGSFTIQPAELVRPFLLVFLAFFLATARKKDLKTIIKSFFLFSIPTFLILIQPSLGVTLLTTVGFIGILLASSFPRKFYIIGVAVALLMLPVGWSILADYQKERLLTFLTPAADPLGVGYNSLQATISVGSGRLTGRGLGRGVGTQLEFLPERQSDFIFASIGEELGFVGATLVLLITFFMLYRLVKIVENTKDPGRRSFVSGFFLAMFAQIIVHVGMNMSILPITGVPYPLVSAGGSSLIATMVGLGIVSSAKSQRTW